MEGNFKRERFTVDYEDVCFVLISVGMAVVGTALFLLLKT